MAEDSHDDYCLKEYKHQFQEDLLRGKVAFITGGASGIGFRIAELLMRHGCDTVIGSRRMEKLQQVGWLGGWGYGNGRMAPSIWTPSCDFRGLAL